MGVKKIAECIYCGSTRDIVRDHVIADVKGGKRTVPACGGCNASKGAKPLMEWLRWVKKNDSNRWKRITAYNRGKSNDIAQRVHTIENE